MAFTLDSIIIDANLRTTLCIHGGPRYGKDYVTLCRKAEIRVNDIVTDVIGLLKYMGEHPGEVLEVKITRATDKPECVSEASLYKQVITRGIQ